MSNRIDLSPNDDLVFRCLFTSTNMIFGSSKDEDAENRKILAKFFQDNAGKTGLFKIEITADKRIFENNKIIVDKVIDCDIV